MDHPHDFGTEVDDSSYVKANFLRAGLTALSPTVFVAVVFGWFLIWGIPKTKGFNTKSWSNDLDDVGIPHFRKHPFCAATRGQFQMQFWVHPDGAVIDMLLTWRMMVDLGPTQLYIYYIIYIYYI